uniref:Uncharacterized protein n=1 Tax=Rhodnius prolixus TaxID=13249 RepID=T1HVN6_RHOPR
MPKSNTCDIFSAVPSTTLWPGILPFMSVFQVLPSYNRHSSSTQEVKIRLPPHLSTPKIISLRMKQRVFIIDDRTQSMPIQSVVDVEAISSSTCIISTAPPADLLDTVVDPLRPHSFFYVPDGTA